VTELARVLAYASRLLAKDRVTRTELKQLLSLRLSWYSPTQASQLIERALRTGLLEDDGHHLRLRFDPATMDLPFDFRGTARALEDVVEPSQDPVISERARALREAAQGRLGEEAARLLARKERGEDVRAEATRQLALLGVADVAKVL
jgi:hypothetical protein